MMKFIPFVVGTALGLQLALFYVNYSLEEAAKVCDRIAVEEARFPSDAGRMERGWAAYGAGRCAFALRNGPR